VLGSASGNRGGRRRTSATAKAFFQTSSLTLPVWFPGSATCLASPPSGQFPLWKSDPGQTGFLSQARSTAAALR
jgi:hypothetical protein